MKSSLFSATTNDKFEWYLLIDPKGHTEKKDTIAVYLYLGTQLLKDESVFAEYTVSIFDEQHKINLHKFCATSQNYGWDVFLNKDLNFRNKLL